MEDTIKTFVAASSADKNAENATCDMGTFVARHRTTLDYLARFGTPLEKAKANVLFKLASGVSL